MPTENFRWQSLNLIGTKDIVPFYVTIASNINLMYLRNSKNLSETLSFDKLLIKVSILLSYKS